MAGKRGGTMHPPSSPLAGAPTTGLPQGIREHTVVVRDPRRILDCVVAQRASTFQWLVRRFVIQIRHGCQEPRCCTPTCHSCQKRREYPPYRRPTPLTARAMAFYLASQDDPQSKLCPHRPAILPEELDIDGELMVELIKGTGVPREKLKFYLGNAANKRSSVRTHNGDSQDSTAKNGHAIQEVALTSRQFWTQYHGLMPKDRKSFTQMLYRTVAARFFEWSTFQSPLQIFQLALDGVNRASNVTPNDREPQTTEIHQRLPSTTSQTFAFARSRLSRDIISDGLRTNDYKIIEEPEGETAQERSLRRIPTTRMHTTPMQGQTVLDRDEPSRTRNHNNLSIDTSREKIEERRQSFPVPVHTWAGHEGISKTKRHSESGLGQMLPLRKGHVNGSTMPQAEPRHPIIGNIQLSCQKRVEKSAESQTAQKQETPTTAKAWAGVPILRLLNYKLMNELSNLHNSVLYRKSSAHDSLLGHVKSFTSATFDPSQSSDNTAFAYIYRSLAYTLSNPASLLQSFHEEGWPQGANSPLPHLNPLLLDTAFRQHDFGDSSPIFDSLWKSLEILFNPPPQLAARKARAPPRKGGRSHVRVQKPIPVYLCDEDAAHIVMICIHALAGHIAKCSPHTLRFVRTSRSWGEIYPPHFPKKHELHPVQYNSDLLDNPWLPILDGLEHEPAIRLANRLVRAIAARRCHYEISKTLEPEGKGKAPMGVTSTDSDTKFPLMDILIRHLSEVKKSLAPVAFIFMEWLRTVILKEWDMSPSLRRWDAVGAAFEIIADLYASREALLLDDDIFELPLVLDAFEPDQLPFDYMTRTSNPNTVHILSFPFVFRRSALVAYFRAINYASMIEAYSNVQFDQQMETRLHWCRWVVTRAQARNRLSDSQRFLLLDVRREHVLEDTFNQLWRRDRAELMRPFKVRISSREGEQGVDQGGVSQEFFRVALAQALDPDAGMFVVDPVNRMAWFKPGSSAPAYQFELLGILVSIAIFNGITLPLTFPLAFYKKLLGGDPVRTVEDIQDGWPDLCKGFDELINWSDGDVEDVFVREYAFGVDLHGKHVSIDMKTSKDKHGVKWATVAAKNGAIDSQKSSEAASSSQSQRFNHPVTSEEPSEMVTNANREEFVADYIDWLVHRSVADEFTAFQRGFFACLDRKALSILTPSILRSLVEGHTTINIAELRRYTRYDDGYHPEHPTIQAFWRVVCNWPPEKHNRLLEFVTASDRVPVNGIQSVNFLISRHTSDSRLLPSAQTCFGRLLLPEYESEEQLRTKLGLALEFGLKGFGFQ